MYLTGIFENSVYDGVFELLGRLREAGVQVVMATSKPEEFAKQIADHFDFAKYFDFIGGACMGVNGDRTGKYEVIEYVLEVRPSELPEYRGNGPRS